MDDALRAQIAAIAADSRSGATAILSRAIGVLRAVASDRAALEEAARELCRAQPAMAGLRVAASLALRAPDAANALDAFGVRVARAPQLIARYAADLLKLRRLTGPLRLVTLSRSHVVEQTLLAVAREMPVEVSCAESRPALEGRDLAVALAAAGVQTAVYSDAGIGSALGGAEALLVGADAIGPETFINKVGTAALVALATARGVPGYVLSGREKILSAEAFAGLSRGRGGVPDEVWPGAPTGVDVRNEYFEEVPSSFIAAVVTDAGIIAPGNILLARIT